MSARFNESDRKLKVLCQQLLSIADFSDISKFILANTVLHDSQLATTLHGTVGLDKNLLLLSK